MTDEKLRMIERAEQALRALGFRVLPRPASRRSRARRDRPRRDAARARARHHAAIVRELKAIGYRYVTLDLQGYRMGSLNEVLRLIPA